MSVTLAIIEEDLVQEILFEEEEEEDNYSISKTKAKIEIKNKQKKNILLPNGFTGRIVESIDEINELLKGLLNHYIRFKSERLEKKLELDKIYGSKMNNKIDIDKAKLPFSTLIQFSFLNSNNSVLKNSSGRKLHNIEQVTFIDILYNLQTRVSNSIVSCLQDFKKNQTPDCKICILTKLLEIIFDSHAIIFMVFSINNMKSKLHKYLLSLDICHLISTSENKLNNMDFKKSFDYPNYLKLIGNNRFSKSSERKIKQYLHQVIKLPEIINNRRRLTFSINRKENTNKERNYDFMKKRAKNSMSFSMRKDGESLIQNKQNSSLKSFEAPKNSKGFSVPFKTQLNSFQKKIHEKEKSFQFLKTLYKKFSPKKVDEFKPIKK